MRLILKDLASTAVRSGPAVALFAILSAFPGVASPGQAYQGQSLVELEWIHLAAGCPEPASGLAVPCGDYGLFVFNTQGAGTCAPLAAGREIPKAYPLPPRIVDAEPLNVPFSSPIPSQPLPATAGEAGILESAVAPSGSSFPDGTLPCAGGSCFEPPGGQSGSERWGAVVDWNDWHGWTTGWTVAHVSGLPVHLFQVDSPDLAGDLGEAVTDAHVLAALCAIAETVDGAAANAPEVVNLSFGRLKSQDDPADATCAGDTLSCQLGRILGHLGEAGATIVASAGNHKETLFPASLPSVLDTGSLDLSVFRGTGEVQASWETPAGTSALVPGNGICLEYPPGEGPPGEGGGSALWAAPAGSSYASALFSGWIADARVQGAPKPPAGSTWAPVWLPDEGCHVLAPEARQSCNQAANAILARISGRQVENCWGDKVQDPHLTIQGPVQPEPIITSVQSLDAWIDSGHAPAPYADFCVPCVTTGDGSGWLTSEGAAARAGGGMPAPGDPPLVTLDDRWVIDLSASAATGDDDYVFHALYLRSGESFYPLLHRAHGESAELASIESGETRTLVLEGFQQAFEAITQPSLMYYICLAQGGPDDCFWTSTPLLTQAPSP